MLICIDETRKVLWYNAEISKEGSQKYLSDSCFWLDSIILPEYPTLKENEVAELFLSENNELYYMKVSIEEPTSEPTEIEILNAKIDTLAKIILGGGLS